jgi:hypothetical protein
MAEVLRTVGRYEIVREVGRGGVGRGLPGTSDGVPIGCDVHPSFRAGVAADRLAQPPEHRGGPRVLRARRRAVKSPWSGVTACRWIRAAPQRHRRCLESGPAGSQSDQAGDYGVGDACDDGERANPAVRYAEPDRHAPCRVGRSVGIAVGAWRRSGLNRASTAA